MISCIFSAALQNFSGTCVQYSLLFHFNWTLQQLFLMSHTFHHKGGTDCSHVLVTQLENNATCANRLARSTGWGGGGGGGTDDFVFTEDMELLWSGLSLRQMQSEKVRQLCSRLQLPKMDLQSYQVGVCWRCNTWSLLSPLWQRTGLDHWRWWGDLRHGDIRGLPQQIISFKKHTGIELNNKSTSHNWNNLPLK